MVMYKNVNGVLKPMETEDEQKMLAFSQKYQAHQDQLRVMEDWHKTSISPDELSAKLADAVTALSAGQKVDAQTLSLMRSRVAHQAAKPPKPEDL